MWEFIELCLFWSDMLVDVMNSYKCQFLFQQDIIIMKNLIRVATNLSPNGVPGALLHINGANVGFRKVVNPLRQNLLFNSQKYWKIESKQTSLNLSKISKYSISSFEGSENTKIESILKEKKINFSQFKLQQSRVKSSGKQNTSNQKISLKEQDPDQNTLKFSQEVQIPKPSQTVIFLKQHYQKLFYNRRNQFPSIKKITFQFFNQRQKKQMENQMKYDGLQRAAVLKYHSKIQIAIFGDIGVVSNQNNKKSKIVVTVVKENYPFPDIVQKQLELDYQIIPCGLQNSTQVAKTLLQKKIWIKISAMLNKVSVYVNDYTPQANNQGKQIVIPLGLNDHTTWQNQEDVFSVNPSSNSSPFRKISLYQLDTMKITYHVEKSQSPRLNPETITQIISDCHIIKTMQVGKIFSPVLSQNPSILTTQANKYLLTNQILSLYEYLRTLQINRLPKLGVVDTNFDQQTYYSWRCLRSAMDKSIKTKPAYLIIGNRPKQPIGILNAIMMVKSIDISKGKPNVQNIFRWTQFNFSNYNNFEECLKQMYEKRTCYVRLQLQDNDATGIGGNIVLEVWPPHCCSSIHNHGQTYGLIKVLANEICVQNFNDLNFLPIDQKPYQNVIYQEGQYTWLSEYSYGIHRLINTTSHLTLSLQAYMGSKGSKEYFEFIVDPTSPQTQKNKYKESKQKLYIEYYPQNDWRNFLAWPEIVDNNKQWLEIPIVRTLYDYIKQVRQFYELGNDRRKWDFPHLVLIMKQEYEIYDNLYKGDKKASIKVQPLQPIV